MKTFSVLLIISMFLGLASAAPAKMTNEKGAVVETQQFISMMKVGRPELQDDFFGKLTPKEMAAFEQHGTYLKKKFDEGKIIFAGPSVEESEEHYAIVVLDAKDKAEAEVIMNGDPAVSIGILTSHVTAFQVFLSREFKTQN
jgi:uncharacterized protein YciI